MFWVHVQKWEKDSQITYVIVASSTDAAVVIHGPGTTSNEGVLGGGRRMHFF